MGIPDGDLLAKLPGKDQGAPKPEDSNITTPNEQNTLESSENRKKNSNEKLLSPKEPNKPKESAGLSPEPPPQANDANAATTKTKTIPPEKTIQPALQSETAAGPEKKIDPAPAEVQPSPEKTTPPLASANATSQPKQKENKESLSLIVTPEDLGKSQITYSVQVGTYLDKDLARIRLDQLKAKQYPAFLVSAWDHQKQLWYTVRVGRYTDIMKAQMAAKEITMKERIPATVYGLGSLRYEDAQESTKTSPENMAPAEKKSATQTSPPAKEDSSL